MAKRLVYVKIKQESENSYCSIKNVKFDFKEIENEYHRVKEVAEKFGSEFPFSLEEYSKTYIPIQVKYDGRRKMHIDDVEKALHKEGVIKKVSEGGLLGGYYQVEDFSKVKNEYYQNV